MARKLKVFRTSTGFHDAYVAAPSRKAALAAWGSDHDLFARGAAEEIDDSHLTAEPLRRPGEVIRLSRGTLADQLAALPPDQPQAAKSNPAEPPLDPSPSGTKAKKKPKPAPRPSRAKLDAAEAAITALDAEQKTALSDLDAREAALRKERRAVEAGQARARKTAAEHHDRVKAAYDEAVDRWRGGG